MISIFKATLTKKEQLVSDVYSFTFTYTDQKMEFKAGQYVILFVPTTVGHPLRRLYSISSEPDRVDSFTLLVKILPDGRGSQYLLHLKEGNEVTFQGPAGMFTLKETPLNKVYLATGTGLAPMLSMLNHQLSHPPAISIKNILLWGVPNFSEVYSLEHLAELKKKLASFDYSICVSREQSLDNAPASEFPCFALGRITAGFEALPQELKENSEFYICGNKDMVEGVRVYLDEHGIPKDRVFFERFT